MAFTPHTPPEAASRGVAVFLTGLPGAGKTTTATALHQMLVARGFKDVVVLDGDQVRAVLSPRLGFTREDRRVHLERVTALALDAVSRGGIAICALVAPYDADRRKARSTIESAGTFLLVHVATPLATCEARDPKGLYALARKGTITRFTGVSDPYETPTDADLTVDTTAATAEEVSERILSALADKSAHA